MLKKTFGLIAVAAFVATVGFSSVKAKIAQTTIWVYAVGGDSTLDPQCKQAEGICAFEHLRNPDGTPGAATGEFKLGKRNDI